MKSNRPFTSPFLFPSSYSGYRFRSNVGLSRTLATSTRESLFGRIQQVGSTATKVWQTTYSQEKTDGTKQEEGTNVADPKMEMSRLLEVAKPERKLIGFALGAQLISATSVMLFPLALGKIVDAVTTTAGSTDLNMLVATMAGVFGVSAVASATRVAAMSLAGSRISRTLRVSLFNAILKQDTPFFDVRQTGELVNRLSNDVPLVSRILTTNVAKILRSGVTSVMSAGFILYLSPKLSLVTMASIPPIVLFAVMFGRAARKLSKQLVDALAEATQVAAEKTGAIRTVRVFGAEKVESNRYAQKVDDTYDLAKRVAMADGLYAGSVQLSAQMSLCGVLWFGGKMVVDSLDPMTIGALTSFSMYAVNLGVAVSGIGTSYGQLTRALGAGHRIFEVIDRKPEGFSSTIVNECDSSEGKTTKKPRPLRRLDPGYDATINFQDVHFKYPTRPETPILNGIDLSVAPGEIIAVAGASGSGKSTMGILLSRLYEPTSGRILLGNEPISHLDTSWLRRQIGVVSQEPVLFNENISDNIRYGLSEHISQEQIMNAAEAAASHEMIMSLPSKYDTRVGERGASLSGGQRARIALCRALVREPKVLVLDELSAALDAESERAVAQSVNNAATNLNMAVMMIAHRTSSLRRAHRIAVLVDGKVAEIGSYDTLMAQDDSHLRQMLNPKPY